MFLYLVLILMPLFTIWNTFHNDNSVIPDAKYEPKTCIAIAACLFSNSTLLDSYHLLLHPWQKCCLGLFGSTSMKWSHPCDLFFFWKISTLKNSIFEICHLEMIHFSVWCSIVLECPSQCYWCLRVYVETFPCLILITDHRCRMQHLPT